MKPFRSDCNRAKIIGIHPLVTMNINKGVDPPWRLRVRDNCYILIYLVYMWKFWSDGGRRGEKWWSWLLGFVLWGPRIFTINLQTCVSCTWCRLWSLYNISLHRNTSVGLAGFQGVFLWSGPTVKHATLLSWIMMNAVYTNLYSFMKCGIAYICVACRRSVTDEEIRDSPHI